MPKVTRKVFGAVGHLVFTRDTRLKKGRYIRPTPGQKGGCDDCSRFFNLALDDDFLIFPRRIKSTYSDGRKDHHMVRHVWKDKKICSAHARPARKYRLKTKELNNYLKDKTMDLIKAFKLSLMKEPKKSLRKAGIIDEEGIITSRGGRIFDTWLLEKNQKEFVDEVVKGLLEDIDSESANDVEEDKY